MAQAQVIIELIKLRFYHLRKFYDWFLLNFQNFGQSNNIFYFLLIKL